MDIITHKDNPAEFIQLCTEQGFEYRTVVHHFEKDARGIYMPVFWSQIEPTTLRLPE